MVLSRPLGKVSLAGPIAVEMGPSYLGR